MYILQSVAERYAVYPVGGLRVSWFILIFNFSV